MSFFGWNDNAPQDDLLTEDKDQQCGDGSDDKCGEADGRRGTLLKLIEIDHHRPHGLLLAEKERQHEVRVGGSEGAQGNDGEDGLGETHGDMPEDSPLAGTVEFGGLEEFARKRIKEALEQEDGVSAGHAGQD